MELSDYATTEVAEVYQEVGKFAHGSGFKSEHASRAQPAPKVRVRAVSTLALRLLQPV